MQNGQKTVTNGRQPSPNQPRSKRSFAARNKRWTSGTARSETTAPRNARQSYERYIALAQAEVQAGDLIGAENFYQHAEHYFRSMSSDRDAT